MKWAVQKRVFGHMQIEPSLSTNRISGYYRMYQWRARIRFDDSESVRFVHVQRHTFA